MRRHRRRRPILEREPGLEREPELEADLERLVDSVTTGDSESPVASDLEERAKLAEALREVGPSRR